MSTLPTPYFAESDRRARVLERCPALEPLFRRYWEEQQIPGLAYGVILDGELIFTQNFGVRHVESGAPVEAETVFRIASMTKSFVALAILQLRDQGRLRLDEPVATYVPEFADLVYPTTDSPPVTVRHLLSMNSGWPQDDPWGDRQIYRTDEAMSDFYRAGVAWSNPPGVTFEYSNYGYMVLGRIITNVAGVGALDYITQQILQPLGMQATVWNPGAVPPDRLAQGYRWEDEQWKAEPLLTAGGDVAGFAGLFTSINDLARWVAFLQAAWPPRNTVDEAAAHGPLRRSSRREMGQSWRTDQPTVRVPALGAPPQLVASGYGFGLSMRHNGRWETIGHGGGLPGFGSHMRWAPAYGIGVIALANLTYAGVTSRCIKAIDLLIEASGIKPYFLPVAPALAAAQAGVLKLLAGWDEEVAATLFAENFLLDADVAHWQQQLDELRAQHGQLTPDGPFEAENWLRGQWRMQGERGWCILSITLSPTVPPLIQELDIESTLPPSPALQALLEQVAALVTNPTKRHFRRLCAPGVDQTQWWDQVRLAHVLADRCTVGEITGGDGSTWAAFTLVGAKRALAVTIKVNERGKLAWLEIHA